MTVPPSAVRGVEARARVMAVFLIGTFRYRRSPRFSDPPPSAREFSEDPASLDGHRPVVLTNEERNDSRIDYENAARSTVVYVEVLLRG